MACYYPLKGYRARHKNESGKYSIVFNIKDGYADMPIQVPCGKCIGCRLEYSRQWAIRCMHEASLYENNCFITLTYNNKNLPEKGTLVKEHFQKFMKRLRKKFSEITIRYYHCGEYGSKNMRPHYHACIFNFDFPDREFFKFSNNIPLYTSKILEELWPYGYSTIGDVTFESAAYVARYIVKKVNGKKAEECDPQTGLSHYEKVNKETGEIEEILPEYTTMSRRPGIAYDWYQRWNKDVYPSDFLVVKGKKMRPPKYYDGMYEIDNPKEYKKIKKKRLKEALKNADENITPRLIQRETVKKAQNKMLVRNLE